MNLSRSYSFIYVLIVLLGIIPPLPQICGYTHWTVTQNGMIEPITTSYYHLRQSWNLVQLIHQERNWDFFQRIERKLNQVSNDLQANEEYQNRVQKYYVDSDSRCVKANKLLSQLNLESTHVLTLEAKGISSQSYLNMSKLSRDSKESFSQPFCDRDLQSVFTMCCYEHLESVRNRSLLAGVPEISLYRVALPPQLTPDEYGHLVSLSLRANESDASRRWILYNMAAFYWRIKGVARHAIDCLRAAIRTSPDQHLDVALVSLANVLQLVGAAGDAIVLMRNAVRLSPQFASHYVILGNLHAGSGQFEAALREYERGANIHASSGDKRQMKDLWDRIIAARCSMELSSAISSQQTKLDEQLDELESFHADTDKFQQARTTLENSRSSNESQGLKQTIYENFAERERLEASKERVDHCLISSFGHERTCEPSEQRMLSSVYVKPQLVSRFSPVQPLVYARLSKASHGPDAATDMRESTCSLLQCEIPHDDSSSPSIHLSPSNKGFDLTAILATAQALQHSSDQQAWSWHPPRCAGLVSESDLTPVDVVDGLNVADIRFPPISPDNGLLTNLLALAPRGVRLEDLGQRIFTTDRLAPKWIALDLAGLYWRVTGDLSQALDCLTLAVKSAPFQYRDVPLVNLAAIFTRLDRQAEALKLIEAALDTDYSEPESHLVAAGIHQSRGDLHLAHHHLSLATQQNATLASIYFPVDSIKCRLCQKYHKANATKTLQKKMRELKHNVTQVFIKHKMCPSMQECRNIIGNNFQYLPHIKVIIKGPTFSPSDIGINHAPTDANHHSNVMYGILWNTNLSNLHIQDHECLLTNDSHRSAGCHHNEDIYTASQNAINFLAELHSIMHKLSPQGSVEKSKWTESQHMCNTERSKSKNRDNNSPPSFKSNTDYIQESIVGMISSRVVLNPLAPEDCEKVAPFDFKTYTPLYVSLNTMRTNVISLLDSLVPGFLFSFNHHPYCVPKGNSFLRQIIDKYKINFESSQHSKVPEYNLHASFLKTFDDKYTLEEIGKRLYTGLEQNSTDWRLATIIVNYWRVSGDAKQAFNCLELAMENSPDFHEKVILVNGANILYRINKLEAALEIAHRALQYPDSQNWIVIPFLVANIFARMDQWHKATLFYEVCLSLKADFEEAIYRIKSIQCQQMVLQNLEHH